MGKYDEEKLEDHERVWLEAHPNIRRKLDILDELLVLATTCHDFPAFRNWLHRYMNEEE